MISFKPSSTQKNQLATFNSRSAFFDTLVSARFIVVSIIIALFILVAAGLNSTSVSAQAGNNGGNSTMNSDTSPAVRAQSYTYWKLASKCVTSHMRNTIKTEAGSNGATSPKQAGSPGSDGTSEGEWFADDAAFGMVYPDGKQTCAQVMKKALTLWGWNNPTDFLRAMGYSFEVGVPQWKSATSDGNQRFERFKNAVLGKVGNVVDLAQGAPMHLLYLNAFQADDPYCQAEQVIKYNDADATLKQWADDNTTRSGVQYEAITIVDGAEPVKYIYTYDSDDESVGQLWRYRGDGWSHDGIVEQYKCPEIAKRISATAADLIMWNDNHPATTEESTEIPATVNPNDPEESAPTCIVDGIGWIICPVMNFLGGVVDAAYGFVSALLVVQPLLTTGGTSGVYEAWVVMRNVANIAFVLAFLIIIFSQLTSFGVSNYGVKKLLPRLVIAAILVNVSFWVCSIAVDLSNILGGSVRVAFDSVGSSIQAPEIGFGDTATVGWQAIVAIVLAGTAGVALYVGLSALIPAILAAALAIVTVFIVLTLRQALIILLIVVSPLAFVAYLLPNTEVLFTKWRKLLTTLLLMYPIIAGIFGASALASQIVMVGATDRNDPYAIAIQIMGALIAILPLALTPVVMKAAGGVLNQFGGIVNNVEKGPVDRLKNLGGKYRERRQNLRDARALSGANQFGRGAYKRWRARRGAVAQSYESEKNRANTEYIAQQMQGNDRFRQSAAGGASASPEAAQRVLANAINAQSKLEADEISAASVVIKDAQFSKAELRELANGGAVKGLDAGRSTALRAAAIQSVVASNDVEQMNSLWDQSRTWEGSEGNKLRQAFADSLQSSSSRPAYYGQGAIAEMRTGSESHKQGSAKKTIIEALKNNAYSPSKLASADKDELGEVAKVLRDSTPEELPAETVLNLRKNANTALTDTELSAVVSKNRTVLQELQGNQGQAASPLITPDNPEFRVR